MHGEEGEWEMTIKGRQEKDPLVKNENEETGPSCWCPQFKDLNGRKLKGNVSVSVHPWSQSHPDPNKADPKYLTRMSPKYLMSVVSKGEWRRTVDTTQQKTRGGGKRFWGQSSQSQSLQYKLKILINEGYLILRTESRTFCLVSRVW